MGFNSGFKGLTNLPYLSFAEVRDTVPTVLGMYKCSSEKQVQREKTLRQLGVILLNQQWSPPLRLQTSHCSTFRIMFDVRSIIIIIIIIIIVVVDDVFPIHNTRVYKK